jgi:phage major head subunit gpT-like protein
MTGQILQYNYVSRDAQVALEEFKQDFMSAYMVDSAEQWAEELGLTIQTDVLKVTLPIPTSAAGYVERKGDRRFRKLSEKHFTFSPRIWQDGFHEFANIVEAPDFIGFQQEPAVMAAAAAQLRNELISAQLEANPTMTGFDDLAFFIASATKHPYNLLDSSVGGFYNSFTGATLLTPENIGLARQRFRQIKGPNGKPLGVKFKGVLIPPALEETMKRIAQQDLVPWAGVASMTGSQGQSSGSTAFGSVNNIYKGTQYWVSDQLTSDIVWYAIGEKPGMYPWSVLNKGAPEVLVLDKTSAMYERESKIGMAAELQTSGNLCFPHLMQKYAGTAS